MSLWWAKKVDLDRHQLALIENPVLDQSMLVTGPPGSGKTNVLLRRAQFCRSQDVSRVLVLTYTRPLVEFIKTGCYDEAGEMIFPPNLIMTIESWIRQLFQEHHEPLPADPGDFVLRKRRLADAALALRAKGLVPRYQTIMVDEVQDLYAEELELIRQWGETLFLVGDQRQKIHSESAGIEAVKALVDPSNRKELPFHYRMAPKICRTADLILVPTGSKPLEENVHYKGPARPTLEMKGGMSADQQLQRCADKLSAELRIYADLIKRGDRLGVIVPRNRQRDQVFQYLEQVPALAGRSQIVRAKDEGEYGSAAIKDEASIYILSLKGCKGLEFRAVHWLFADCDAHHRDREEFYTGVTRAKTDLDVTSTGHLPAVLAQAHSPTAPMSW